MAIETPIPRRVSDAGLLRLIRQLAQDSSNIYLESHARLRMKQRKISNSQVLACLRRGDIHEPAHQDIRGRWKCTLKYRWAGDEIHAAVALERDEDGAWVAVVTVF